MAAADEVSQTSTWTYSIHVDGSEVETDTTDTGFQHIISDVGENYLTLIGGYEQANALKGLYQGNIYSFWMKPNGVAADFSSLINQNCENGTCAICPAGSNKCLGECQWNAWFDG